MGEWVGGWMSEGGREGGNKDVRLMTACCMVHVMQRINPVV